MLIEDIYIYVGQNWINTLHSSAVRIFSTIRYIIEKKNTNLFILNINALHDTIIYEIISRYEQLLTSIKITITDFEQKSYTKKPSEKMHNYLDVVTK
jgi:magnesium transporter